ncbi:MAG: hypothetical protein JJK57_07805 [Komagataeibacter hansenii]|nr:hypothetical protein [Novacetimonas hansenii]
MNHASWLSSAIHNGCRYSLPDRQDFSFPTAYRIFRAAMQGHDGDNDRKEFP